MPPAILQEAANHDEPHQILLGMSNIHWTLNGKTFEMEAFTPEETVKFGNLEVGKFINAMNMGGMLSLASGAVLISLSTIMVALNAQLLRGLHLLGPDIGTVAA